MSGASHIHSPRLERFGPKLLTGLLRPHSTMQDDREIYTGIAAQWGDYAARCQTLAGTAVPKSLGVGLHQADGDLHFQYFCGAETETQGRNGFATLHIPALYCAVFPYLGHRSEMRLFLQTIYRTVLPTAGIMPAPHGPGEPEFIERYDERFDHQTGEGVFDLLFPIIE